MLLATLASPSPNAALSAWLASALALALATALRRVRGTTLGAPLWWAIAVAASMALVEGALAMQPAWGGTPGATLARYAAAVGSCCPIIAVLGAKRPQNRGWQWVVLSFWIVLLVPAGQAWITHSGPTFVLPWPWVVVLATATTLIPLNYLATRWAVASVVVALAQYLLLQQWTVGTVAERTTPAAAVTLFLAAAILCLLERIVPRYAGATTLDRFSNRWLAFRNGWGAFWGLRVLNRINESAQLSGWPVRLTWGGFAAVNGDAAPDVDDRLAAQIDQAMDSLLWRFERVASQSRSD